MYTYISSYKLVNAMANQTNRLNLNKMSKTIVVHKTSLLLFT